MIFFPHCLFSALPIKGERQGERVECVREADIAFASPSSHADGPAGPNPAIELDESARYRTRARLSVPPPRSIN